MDSRDKAALPNGLYEKLVSREVREALDSLSPDLSASRRPLTARDVDLIGQYVQRLVTEKLRSLPQSDKEDEERRRIVACLTPFLRAFGAPAVELADPGEVLMAVYPRNETPAARPDGALTENALYTGGLDQMQLGPRLVQEIRSADHIYFVISFIRWSGLNILLDALEEAVSRKHPAHVQVVTTTYMGVTEFAAIERLNALPNTDVYITYDERSTRLHAKSYVFLRNTGYDTAYVGSSNVSDAALTTGFEWNVRISREASPGLLQTIVDTCEAYVRDPQFELYDAAQADRLREALRGIPGGEHVSPDMKPYPYQESILERLHVERSLYSRMRNLVVAATGTGKTVIGAFDYKRFRELHPDASNLLFVAHREEILEQARSTFQAVLGSKGFGTLLVGGTQPDTLHHLFASVQMLHRRRLWEKLGPDFFDYIVIDETHHIAARSYREILHGFRPKILLGLTATPERADGQNILADFGGRAAAEIRLPEAIDEGLLCPFQYFGLADTVDLSQVKWTARGYDTNELTNLYSLNTEIARRRAAHILSEFRRHTDPAAVCALGFCVSVEHANFMTAYFREHGVSAECITGGTPDPLRKEYRRRLENGTIQVIFCVDVFNEGVDIPCLNTILLLRPTESLTIFVQQLGRGLRLFPGKDALCVLDFIGNANRNYRFEEKLRALLPPGRNVGKSVRAGFPFLPRGCFIELQKKPMEIVLASIKAGFDGRSALLARVEEYRDEVGRWPNIGEFLAFYDLEPKDLYRYSTFDDLLRQAQGRMPSDEPLAKLLAKPANRQHFAFIDSYRWLKWLQKTLPQLPDVPETERNGDTDRMLGMLYTSIWGNESIPDMRSREAEQAFRIFRDSPDLTEELTGLFGYMSERISKMSWPLDLGEPCPLDIHCTYSRNQLLAAFGERSPGSRQDGVYWLPERKGVVLLVTVEKLEKYYSDSTQYKDYAIDSTLFHWQSQSRTTADSPEAQRYRNHREQGAQVFLFVRETKKTGEYGTMPYTFLGPADFVSASGSAPLSVIWRLHRPVDPAFLPKISRIAI